jgi:hypothetical protein
VLRLERVIEPQDAKFEDVRDAVEADLKASKLKLLKQQVLRELIASADINYVNPVLKGKADEAAKAGQP